ncbi:hypothetical protein FGO68_gene4162 [Halteria grandinella]|uniref:Uncharacterized protein n=1 Tax=Halteria grandinella TaxID=5974 RepID=A0A8J8NCQ4_HALGN|nr:hypothetical protein FGO68_gene4162 [Halteria grandinella]
MDDHINGRYCNRSMNSKKDSEAYKPGKIFTSMYQKAYQSRNFNDDEKPNEDGSAEMGKLMSKTMGIKTSARPNMFEVLGKSGQAPGTAAQMAAEAEAVVKKGKNSYSPDFVSTLNFNFNTNDAFGTRIKKSAAQSLLKSHQSIGKQDQQNRNGNTFGVPAGSSFVSLNSLLRDSREQLRSQIIPQTTTNTDEESKLRREMNSQILKNQYSFWAGMYVKRMVAAQPDSKNNTLDDIKENPVVPFGDPRSLTQCIDFNRKKPPHLPEQEMKSGGGIRPLGIPQRFEKSKKPPSHKSSRRGAGRA